MQYKVKLLKLDDNFEILVLKIQKLILVIFFLLTDMLLDEKTVFSEPSEDGPTIGQFLHFVENQDWEDEYKKEHVNQMLKGPAKQWASKNLQNDMDWDYMKIRLIEHFRSNLSIKEKVKMRKSLVQDFTESCQDFLNR